jgi:hypothetical protein
MKPPQGEERRRKKERREKERRGCPILRESHARMVGTTPS